MSEGLSPGRIAACGLLIIASWLPLSFAIYAFLHLVNIALVAQLGKPTSGSSVALDER